MILVVLVMIAVFWLSHAPPAPAVQTGGIDAKALSDYQALLKSAREEALAFFQAIVVQALLPVLTLILACVFGSQKN